MIIGVASGKGGTGKTTVAVNLALSISKIGFLDCDVEEPNAEIFLKPELEEKEPVCVQVPEIDEEKCTRCGECADFCRYNALAVTKEMAMVFPELCHACRGCKIICPENAIEMVEREIGVIQKGKREHIDFRDGILNIGEAMATPVIRKLKEEIGEKKDVIIDAPPGAACPVIEALEDVDFCVLVVEPTPFGLSDLKNMHQTLEKLRVDYGVVVNKAGIGDQEVYEFCQEKDIEILMEIPFDQKIAESYSRGQPLVEAEPKYREKFQKLYEKIRQK